MQSCQHFTGTAARVLDATAWLRPEWTREGAQHLPDPPREIQGPSHSPLPRPLLLLLHLEGTALNAKEETADMDEGEGPHPQDGVHHPNSPPSKPHRPCPKLIYVRALGWFLAPGPLPPRWHLKQRETANEQGGEAVRRGRTVGPDVTRGGGQTRPLPLPEPQSRGMSEAALKSSCWG